MASVSRERVMSVTVPHLIEANLLDTLESLPEEDPLRSALARLVAAHNSLAETTTYDSQKVFRRLHQLEARQKDLFSAQDARVGAQLQRFVASEARMEQRDRDRVQSANHVEADLRDGIAILNEGQAKLQRDLADLRQCTHDLQAQEIVREGHMTDVSAQVLDKRFSQAELNWVESLESSRIMLRQRLADAQEEFNLRFERMQNEFQSHIDETTMQKGRIANLEHANERILDNLDQMSNRVEETASGADFSFQTSNVISRVERSEAVVRQCETMARDSSRATQDLSVEFADLSARLERSDWQSKEFMQLVESRLAALQAEMLSMAAAADACRDLAGTMTTTTAAGAGGPLGNSMEASHSSRVSNLKSIASEEARPSIGAPQLALTLTSMPPTTPPAASSRADEERTRALQLDIQRLEGSLRWMERRVARSDDDMSRLMKLARFMDVRLQNFSQMEQRLDEVSVDCERALRAQNTALSTKCLACGKGELLPAAAQGCSGLALASGSGHGGYGGIQPPAAVKDFPATSGPSTARSRPCSAPAQHLHYQDQQQQQQQQQQQHQQQQHQQQQQQQQQQPPARWSEAGWEVRSTSATEASVPAADQQQGAAPLAIEATARGQPAQPRRPSSAPVGKRVRPSSARCAPDAAQQDASRRPSSASTTSTLQPTMAKKRAAAAALLEQETRSHHESKAADQDRDRDKSKEDGSPSSGLQQPQPVWVSISSASIASQASKHQQGSVLYSCKSGPGKNFASLIRNGGGSGRPSQAFGRRLLSK